MTDHRSDDALNESAIDREIKAALSVEPSPEFLARVRTRVANESARASWRWSWVATMASCVAVPMIVIAVVIVSRSGQRTESISVDRAPLVATTDENLVVRRPTVDPARGAEADVKTGRTGVVSGFGRTTDAGRTEPEILIDPAEARALRRLLEGVRVGRIDVTILPPELPQVMTTIQPLGEIAPLPPIEPLGQLRQGEGVQQ